MSTPAWGTRALLYLQVWSDVARTNQLVAFDESGEAKVGSIAEMASLRRFVPEYFTAVHAWLAKRIGGFGSEGRN